MDTDKLKELRELYYSFGESKRKPSDVQRVFLQEILDVYANYCVVPCHLRGRRIEGLFEGDLRMCSACNIIINMALYDEYDQCWVCKHNMCNEHIAYYCKHHKKPICYKCIGNLQPCIMSSCSGKLFKNQKNDENEKWITWMVCTKCEYEVPEYEVCTKGIRSL